MEPQQVTAVLIYLLIGTGGLLLSAVLWFMRKMINQIELLAREKAELDKRLAILERVSGMDGRRHENNSPGT